MKFPVIAIGYLIGIFAHFTVSCGAFVFDEVRSCDKVSIDTLVVCPVEFQPALNRWLEYRTEQGRTIKVIPPQPSAAKLAEQIREIARQSELKFVFLIGDVAIKRDIAARPAPLGIPANRLGAFHALANPEIKLIESPHDRQTNLSIPMHYVPAQVNQLYGSEPEISTDHPYADLNGDGLPDIAVGRLPANSLAEVHDYLDRVITYETQPTKDQHWKRRVNFVAGVGGFGTAIDNVLEQFTKEVMTGMIPPEYQTSMTLGSWRSPFCPDPRNFGKTVVERFNEGCMFWVYIGHGRPTELDSVRLPDQRFPILNPETANEINCVNGSPIAIFLSCYTGAIDHQQDCLTKVLLRQPCGPIAVISGTRVTMPYGMSLLMLEVAQDYFSNEPETLGELLQTAKRKMVVGHDVEINFDESIAIEQSTDEITELDRLRRMVHGAGKALSPNPKLLPSECQEHLSLMHLYGDPLLRLERPKRIELQTDASARSGTKLQIQGTTPVAGKLCIELAYPRDRFRKRPNHRRHYEGTDAAFCQYQKDYDAAHDLTCDVCLEVVEAGPFQVTLKIPTDTSGECLVRCILESPDGFALGATKLWISD